MAYISQATLLADTFRFSYSTFFRIPTSGNSLTNFLNMLFEFGIVPEIATTDNCVIQIRRQGASSLTTIEVLAVGPFISAHGNFSSGNPSITITAFNWNTASLPTTGTQFFVFDTWQHLAVSLDITVPNTIGIGVPAFFSQGTKCKIILDQVNLTTKTLGVTGSFGSGDAGTTGTPPNWKISNPILWTGPNGNITDQSWSMPLASTEVGFPVNANDAGSTNPLIMEFAYTFTWMDQYIDWSIPANLAKLVYTGDDGLPWPADTTGQLAIQAFGPPSFFFRGGKDEYIINKGTAGPMTLTGTSSDFAPAPGSPSALGPGV